MLDVDAARAAVAAAGSVGVVGYCWGGLITWLAACRLKGFACAVSYYGGGILEAAAEQPKCPVIAHFGERDHVIPVAGVRAFAEAHPDVGVYIYAADHGFNCDQRGVVRCRRGDAGAGNARSTSCAVTSDEPPLASRLVDKSN